MKTPITFKEWAEFVKKFGKLESNHELNCLKVKCNDCKKVFANGECRSTTLDFLNNEKGKNRLWVCPFCKSKNYSWTFESIKKIIAWRL